MPPNTLDEDLDPAVDPYSCPACIARRDVCDHHIGVGVGWDRAMAVMAALVNGAHDAAGGWA